MKTTLIVLFSLFALSQLIQIEKLNPKTDPSLEIQAPKEVMTILRKACYDCHSNETSWPWYSNIAPVSWMIEKHVEEGRAWVNYSLWNTYSQEEQDKKLKETFRAIYVAMPPSDYMSMHEKANLTKSERKLVRDWIKGMDKH